MAKAETQLIPIHVSIDEVKSFNYMQGGQFVDPATGLREYSRLLPIFRVPVIQDMFIAMSNHVIHHKKLPEDVSRIEHELAHTDKREQYYEEIPSDSDPEIQKLEALGDGDDKKIVLMPTPIVEFMDKIQGKIKRDPTMGLQEFGFFNEIIRGIATVVGAVVGGPIGAGVGNLAGRVATGASPSKSFIPAAKIGAATWGLGQAAGLAGKAIPGLASAAPGVFGANASWGATPSILGGAGAAATNTAANVAPGATAAGASGASGVLSSLPSWIAPAALIGGGMYFNQKSTREKEKMMRELEQRRRQEVEQLRARYGYDEPMQNKLRLFPHDPQKILRGEFKKGGHVTGRPIVGRGKGQEDLIKDDGVKEGSWIWDASTTADWGDGSTNAGQKEIAKLEKYIAKHVPVKKLQHLDHGGKAKIVPCALSDGERHTPTPIVTAAAVLKTGHASNTKGAEIFRKMTKVLRKHKNSNGTELPPAAPDIIKLFKQVG